MATFKNKLHKVETLKKVIEVMERRMSSLILIT